MTTMAFGLGKPSPGQKFNVFCLKRGSIYNIMMLGEMLKNIRGKFFNTTSRVNDTDIFKHFVCSNEAIFAEEECVELFL